MKLKPWTSRAVAKAVFSKDLTFVKNGIVLGILWVMISFIVTAFQLDFVNPITTYVNNQYGSSSSSTNFNDVQKNQHATGAEPSVSDLSHLIQSKCRQAFLQTSNDLGDIRIHQPLPLTSSMSDLHSNYLQFDIISDWGIIETVDEFVTNKSEPDGAMVGIKDIESLKNLISALNTDMQRDWVSHGMHTLFVMSLGDHFYNNNIDTSIHERWNFGFESLFQGSHLSHKVFIAALGNNDYVLDDINYIPRLKKQNSPKKNNINNIDVAAESARVDGSNIDPDSANLHESTTWFDVNGIESIRESLSRPTEASRAQIERTFWSDRWCMPHAFYTLRFVINNCNDPIELKSDQSSTCDETLRVRLIVLDTTSLLKNDESRQTQLTWMAELLEKSEKSAEDDWIIVAGHHPFEKAPQTCVESKDAMESTDEMQEKSFRTDAKSLLQQEGLWRSKMKPFLKLMVKYDNVGLYASGHHHIWRLSNLDVEHSAGKDRKEEDVHVEVYVEENVEKNVEDLVDFEYHHHKLWLVVNGANGRNDTKFCYNFPPNLISGGSQATFSKFRVYKDRMEVSFIDSSGRVLLTQRNEKHLH